MTKYYAYEPTPSGEEPFGSDKHMLFRLKTDKGAIRRAKRRFGTRYVLVKYTNFYNKDTWKRVI